MQDESGQSTPASSTLADSAAYPASLTASLLRVSLSIPKLDLEFFTYPPFSRPGLTVSRRNVRPSKTPTHLTRISSGRPQFRFTKRPRSKAWEDSTIILGVGTLPGVI